jgi:DNA-binding SARP family transcriptional activator
MNEEDRTWEIQLLGGWQIRHGKFPVKVTIRQQRLIAVLALYGSQPRPFLAGLLWPDSSERQATGSLRETIWMVSHQLPGLLVESRDPLALAEDVVVDVNEIRQRLATLDGDRAVRLRPAMLDLLRTAELLPGWYEDWVVAEQDRWKQLRLTALERLASQHLDRGETDLATDAAGFAIAIEPLRESAQRLLLETHIADGNYAQALRAFKVFRTRLWNEFGVEPSAKITNLMAPLLMEPASAGATDRPGRWPFA